VANFWDYLAGKSRGVQKDITQFANNASKNTKQIADDKSNNPLVRFGAELGHIASQPLVAESNVTGSVQNGEDALMGFLNGLGKQTPATPATPTVPQASTPATTTTTTPTASDPDFLSWALQSGLLGSNEEPDTSGLDASYQTIKNDTSQEYQQAAAAQQAIYNQLAQMNSGDAAAQQKLTNGQVAEDQAVNKSTAANINAGYDSANANEDAVNARLGLAPSAAATQSNEENRANDVSNAATTAGNAEQALNSNGANQADFLQALPSANRAYGANTASQTIAGLPAALAAVDAAQQSADLQYQSANYQSPLDQLTALLPFYQQQYGTPQTQEQMAYDQAQLQNSENTATNNQAKITQQSQTDTLNTLAKLMAIKNPSQQVQDTISALLQQAMGTSSQ